LAVCGRLRLPARIGADGIAYRRCCAPVVEHPCSRQGSTGTCVAPVENYRQCVACLDRGTGNCRSTGTVRQCTGRSDESMGFRVCP
jgi:hypothetical protein